MNEFEQTLWLAIYTKTFEYALTVFGSADVDGAIVAGRRAANAALRAYRKASR